MLKILMIKRLFKRGEFFIIAGPNVIESEAHATFMATELKRIADEANVNLIFKASYDKANRTSIESYRGPGIEEGLAILSRIKKNIGVPVITDVHETSQVSMVSQVVDIIQVPAFLCRQTELLKSVAETGLPVHVKKGQFASANIMLQCVKKLQHYGAQEIVLCERGTMFGYGDLVVDPRNIEWMKSPNNYVSMDITHCLQRPGMCQSDGIVTSGGYRKLIPLMGRVAIAAGVDGIFVEVHDTPDESKCDAPTQFPLARFPNLLNMLNSFHRYMLTQLNKNDSLNIMEC